MSESAPPTIGYASPSTEPKPPTSPILQLAGAIGFLACATGLTVLLASCAGKRWFMISPYIVYAAGAGLLLALLAAAVQRRKIGEETHVMAALFANVIAIVGGLMIMAVWKGWPLFAK